MAPDDATDACGIQSVNSRRAPSLFGCAYALSADHSVFVEHDRLSISEGGQVLSNLTKPENPSAGYLDKEAVKNKT